MTFISSLIAYAIGLTSMAYFFWFVAFSLNSVTTNFNWTALASNAAIFLLFPLQHSVLAREKAKVLVTRLLNPIPERSFYVGTSGFVMWMILLSWNRFGPILYSVGYAWVFDAVFYCAIALIIWSTIELDHSRMFGLKHEPGKNISLQTTGIYSIVRHPITSLLIVALWAHETMTAGRLLFNLLFTSYALLGTILEERNLRATFPHHYPAYAARVPAFIPRLKR